MIADASARCKENALARASYSVRYSSDSMQLHISERGGPPKVIEVETQGDEDGVWIPAAQQPPGTLQPSESQVFEDMRETSSSSHVHLVESYIHCLCASGVVVHTLLGRPVHAAMLSIVATLVTCDIVMSHESLSHLSLEGMP